MLKGNFCCHGDGLRGSRWLCLPWGLLGLQSLLFCTAFPLLNQEPEINTKDLAQKCGFPKALSEGSGCRARLGDGFAD